MDTIRQKTDREYLNPAQRFGELVALVLMMLPISFFVYHLAANTGFFTSAFGPLERLLFFGPMVLTMAAPMVRAVVGRRNHARPLEVATNLFLGIAAIWLLNVFPFDFSHFPDALPSGIRFLFAWVNNEIGRMVLVIQLIVCPIAAILTAWQYIWHLLHEPGNPSGQRSAL
jgi:hypothetical protein